MNNEPTNQSDFDNKEEDDISVKINESEEHVEVVLNESSHKLEKSDTFIKREISYIEKHRKKLRLVDPKGVHYFRHIPISYAQSILHFISLVISVCLFSLFISEFKASYHIYVKGIGWVSNITAIDVFTLIIIFVILFIQLRGLFKAEGVNGLKRYKLAMLSNSVNSVTVKFIKINILIFLLFLSITLAYEISIDVVIEKYSNGIFADMANFSLSIISILIVAWSFRFCKKGLAE